MCTSVPSTAAASTIMTAVSVTTPLVIEGVAYVILVGKLCLQQCRPSNLSPRSRRNVILIKLLAVTYVWNIGCFAPVPIMVFLIRYTGLGNYAYVWLRSLEQCGSAGTPAIFICMNLEYKKGLRNLFVKKRKYQEDSSAQKSLRQKSTQQTDEYPLKRYNANTPSLAIER
ncbi:uncharacterized protein LOC129596448 [Paramacrobiotus metropolitanus]|uniref:uncharacterized protein LOC129596448 n=1 Tax=Paramacrobiotus metropolitanus TaxID=2943436 RepID=UPI002445987B|nr:uncharacterized protein LOC129596448 [Paramacrobiotus metropolitanus]